MLEKNYLMGLLNISLPWQIQAQEQTAIISWRECSKKSVQQGRSHFDARSVHEVREHGKMARTPLAAYFNIPLVTLPGSPSTTPKYRDRPELMGFFSFRYLPGPV